MRTPVIHPGIYAVASLSGEPIAPELAAAFATVPTSAPGLHLNVSDPQAEACSIFPHGQEITALAGFLDEPEELAAVLSLPPEAVPAQLAAAALDRFGPETPDRLLGEWTLLHWHAPSRTLTLVCSRGRRDRTCFARKGGLLLVAPNPVLLGRHAPGGLSLSPLGLLREHARAPLRMTLPEQTAWRHVEVMHPGESLHFTSSGCQRSRCASPEIAPPWSGSFADAVQMLDALGRRILRGHLRRVPRLACLLSGGIDSSLLSVWAALEHGSQPAPVALCSVAPPGSGLPDEAALSQATARQLGMPWHAAFPGEEDDLFRPGAELFRWDGGPIVGGRFPVYAALRRAAFAAGASALVDGVYGEGSVTASAPHPRWGLLRSPLDSLRRWKHAAPPPAWPDGLFHARWAPEALAELPAEWRQASRDPEPATTRDPQGLLGYGIGLRRAAQMSTAAPNGLRHLLPYRDLRLLRAASGLPRAFLSHGGHTRALARALLAGRVPEPVRLRTARSPFSPDFVSRLRRQAPATLLRVPLYREAGLATWLDLGWLESALAHIAREPNLPAAFLYDAQQTAHTAEFLLWADEIVAQDRP